MALSTCTLTMPTSVAAISGAVSYEPLPNQMVENTAIDTLPVTANASGTTYSATLFRKVKYRIHAPRFGYLRQLFTVPDASTANIYDLIPKTRRG